jgi:hypothetical protein
MNAQAKPNEVIAVSHPNLAAALAAAQGELRNPEKGKTAKVKGKTKTGQNYEYEFKYADIGDVLEAVLPVLSRHGLALVQPTRIGDGAIFITTRLLHTSGEALESDYPVCSLNGEHQKMGAAMTYARRYALTSLLGVSAVEDTDATGTAEVGDGPRKQMTSGQAKKEINWAEVEKAIDECETFEKLSKREDLVEDRKTVWPSTYYWKAKERITGQRLAIIETTFEACDEPDALSDAFADVEAQVGHLVSYEEIAARHQKRATALENAL